MPSVAAAVQMRRVRVEDWEVEGVAELVDMNLRVKEFVVRVFRRVSPVGCFCD